MPIVSVIFVFHQVTPYLRPALRSILTQSLSDIEVLVVDNGTGLGLSAFGDEGRDPRLRLISFPENRGIPPAHNTALALAKGEFIALMDYDDVALPLRFERQLAALRARPQLGLVFTHALEIDGEDRPVQPAFTLASAREQFAFSAYSMPATSPTSFGRLEVFRENPFREELAVAPDLDFTSRVLEKHPSEALPEILFHYRRHGEQTTARRRGLQQFNVSICRLLTARRRAGRSEGFGELRREIGDWMNEVPPPAFYFRWFARRALADNLPLLAVYFARKLLATRRDPDSLLAAMGVTAVALRAAPGCRSQLARMLFTGPLRTHGLNPL